ncbi:hypothetical protein ACJX0J_031259, partial [Zea mays]
FWTEVFKVIHVIFQIFGAIFKMGDHGSQNGSEVRAQSNPIQTTWACCVKNKEKRGAELEVSVDPKETYEKGNCFTIKRWKRSLMSLMFGMDSTIFRNFTCIHNLDVT